MTMIMMIMMMIYRSAETCWAAASGRRRSLPGRIIRYFCHEHDGDGDDGDGDGEDEELDDYGGFLTILTHQGMMMVMAMIIMVMVMTIAINHMMMVIILMIMMMMVMMVMAMIIMVMMVMTIAINQVAAILKQLVRDVGGWDSSKCPVVR